MIAFCFHSIYPTSKKSELFELHFLFFFLFLTQQFHPKIFLSTFGVSTMLHFLHPQKQNFYGSIHKKAQTKHIFTSWWNPAEPIQNWTFSFLFTVLQYISLSSNNCHILTSHSKLALLSFLPACSLVKTQAFKSFLKLNNDEVWHQTWHKYSNNNDNNYLTVNTRAGVFLMNKLDSFFFCLLHSDCNWAAYAIYMRVMTATVPQ